MPLGVEGIKRVVTTQKEEIEEIFEKERIIKREYGTDLGEKYLIHPNVLAILGVRRCGKSVFSLLLLKQKKYGYINFDDERMGGIVAEDLDSVLQAFYELYGSDIEYLVFDEIQNVPGWELFVNRLRRTNKLIITGSNSKLLAGELATYLTGRYIDFTLFPFSFREFLIFNDVKIKREDFYSTKKTGEIKRLLERYVVEGSFPEAYKFGKKIVTRIYEDIITKDVINRYNIRYKKTFKDILRYLITNFSSEITFNKLKNIFEIKDLHTVRNYIDYANSAYLLFLIERFSFKLKQQIIAPKKIYCVDTGMINAISFRSDRNLGKVLENLVAVELLRRKNYWHNEWEVFYWKDHQQREVDFVIKEGTKVKQLIQVCHDINDLNTKERELRALFKASKELRCKNLLIIDWEREETLEKNGKKVEIVPLWKWLLQI